jgi:hypothetical protein
MHTTPELNFKPSPVSRTSGIFFCFNFLILSFFAIQFSNAQPVTGVWQGRIGSLRIELKLIRKGDSLIGTSYYYDSKSNYRRYSVKGFFDGQTNDLVWWDDMLIEAGTGHGVSAQRPMLAVADFNCPGEGVMKLDGNVSQKEDRKKDRRELHLLKGNSEPLFPDEWDFLIQNYAYGVSHPGLVDSIEYLAFRPAPPSEREELPSVATSVALNQPSSEPEKPLIPVPAESSSSPESPGPAGHTTGESPDPAGQPAATVTPPGKTVDETALPESPLEKFASRKKVLQQVIPVKGDSIEIRFYDNAEIDGDSIAVFLNGRLLQQHILLAENAYTMKIAVSDLQADNELVMVAENLGSIPPNTSLMVAIVDDKRYEAHLQSTEGSSALVRLVKP